MRRLWYVELLLQIPQNPRFSAAAGMSIAWKEYALHSISLQEEFVASAVMSNKDFAAVKGQISIALSDTQTPTMAMASNQMYVSCAPALRWWVPMPMLHTFPAVQ